MAARFTEIGAPAHLARLWFTTLLRDGFALTAAGAQESFALLGAQALRVLLAGVPLNRDTDTAIDHVMNGFSSLPTHPDVPDGVRALRATGRRLVTLTNGSTGIAEHLLTNAGIADEFEALMSVEDAGAWKPARAAYDYAARRCHTSLGEMLLVAVHPWDIDGAARAGMATAWINRTGAPYPAYFTEPRYTISALDQLAERLPR
jgi:2-haloacid dehalogenase